MTVQMTVQWTKLDCKVTFIVLNQTDKSGPHHARIDLFEHRYDDKATFWYGVAEVACTLREFFAANRAGEGGGFRVKVELSDDRSGDCCVLGGAAVLTPQELHAEFLRVHLVGVMPLKAQGHASVS
jgi:hypothetical protein